MLSWLKNLLYDSATFEQYLRTGFAGLWAAYEFGLIPKEVNTPWLWYVSKIALVLAFLMRAGDKNAAPRQ